MLPAKPPSTRSILRAPSHCRALASVSPLSGMAFEGWFFLILKVSFQMSPYQRYLPLLGKPVNCPTPQLLSVIFPLDTVTLCNILFIITLSIILPSRLLHLCHSLLCIGPPWSTHPSFLSFLTPISQPQLSYIPLFLFLVGAKSHKNQGILVLFSDSLGLNMVPGSLEGPKTCLLSG